MIKKFNQFINESKQELSQDEIDDINYCLVDLYDKDFKLNRIESDTSFTSHSKCDELRISLYKHVDESLDDIGLSYKLNKEGVYNCHSSGNIDKVESEIYETAEEVSHKLINHLDYDWGDLNIHIVTPLTTSSINIHIILKRTTKLKR